MIFLSLIYCLFCFSFVINSKEKKKSLVNQILFLYLSSKTIMILVDVFLLEGESLTFFNV